MQGLLMSRLYLTGAFKDNLGEGGHNESWSGWPLSWMTFSNKVGKFPHANWPQVPENTVCFQSAISEEKTQWFSVVDPLRCPICSGYTQRLVSAGKTFIFRLQKFCFCGNFFAEHERRVFSDIDDLCVGWMEFWVNHQSLDTVIFLFLF